MREGVNSDIAKRNPAKLALTEGNVSDLVACLQLKEGGNRHTGSNGQHVKLAPMYLRRKFRPLTENKIHRNI